MTSRRNEQLKIEQVRKRGLPPLLLGWDERGQAPLPDLFYFLGLPLPDLFYLWGFLFLDLFYF